MTNTPDDYSGSSGNDTGNLVTEQVKQSAQQVAQQSQDVASQVVQGAQQQAQSMLSTRKDQLTGSLNSAADALRQTGDTLRNSDQAPMAGIMDTAAEKSAVLPGTSRDVISDRSLPTQRTTRAATRQSFWVVHSFSASQLPDS
jgi:hypothetical protein